MDEDMRFPACQAKPWTSLVELSKPLTDAGTCIPSPARHSFMMNPIFVTWTWSTTLPQLTSLLEANRTLHLVETAEACRVVRAEHIYELLTKLKLETHPFQASRDALKPSLPPDSRSASPQGSFSTVNPELGCAFPTGRLR